MLDDVIQSVDHLHSEVMGRNVSDFEKVSLHQVVESFAASVVINTSTPVYKVTTDNIHVKASGILHGLLI